MQRARVNGVELAYVDVGQGPETVVLSHSYLVDHRQFEAQIEALRPSYRVIAFDHRDHGQSERMSGSYSLDDLVDDAVGLLRELDAAPCHWIGLSTGGFVGIRIGFRHPELLRSLVLMDSSAEREPSLKRLKYAAMFLFLRLFGARPLAGEVMRTMFGRSTGRDPARLARVAGWREHFATLRHEPIRFGNAIFAREDVRHRLPEITAPTLVMVGAEDEPLGVPASRTIAAGIPGARFELIPEAGHLSTLEQPDTVNAHLLRFLAENATE